MLTSRALIVGFLALLIVGCGNNTVRRGGGACTPGAQLACACTDGTQGAQVCNSEGELGTCQCTPDGDTGGTDGGSDSGVTGSDSGGSAGTGSDSGGSGAASTDTGGGDTGDSTSATGGSDTGSSDTGGSDTGSSDTGSSDTGGDTGSTGSTGDSGDGTTGGDGGPVTVAQIQTGAGSVGCAGETSSTVATGLVVENLVVSSPQYEAFEGNADDPALDGFFASQGTGKNTGIEVVFPAALGVLVSPGDVVTVTGAHSEFFCQTQILADSVQITGSQAAPQPVHTTCAALTSGDVEGWEGSLVRLTNVTVEAVGQFDATLSGGCKFANGPFASDYFPTVGDHFPEVVGVVSFRFGTYRLEPRSPADVASLQSAPTSDWSVADIQSSPESTGCAVEGPNEVSHGAITTQGVVAAPIYTVNSTLNGFYIADGSGSWSGVFVVYPSSLGFVASVGDQVVIQGQTIEYFCFTEVVADSLSVVGSAPVPSPVLMTPADWQGDLEPWEGVRVTLGNLFVEDTSDGTLPGSAGCSGPDLNCFGQVTASGIILNFGHYQIDHNLSQGQVIQQVTGFIRYSFGAYQLIVTQPGDFSVQ